MQTSNHWENSIGNKAKRTKFDKSHTHITTLNTGELIPIMWDEVYPGDTWEGFTRQLIRATTQKNPVMDNSYVEINFWFVPNRLVMEEWKYFQGESKSAWAQKSNIQVPHLKAPDTTGWKKGGLADRLGFPINTPNITNSALPVRAYTLIWNEWYRDQNLQDEAHLDKGSSDKQGRNEGDDYVTRLELGGAVALANKCHDYFTSALPGQQKGDPVEIKLLGDAPVVTRPQTHEQEQNEIGIILDGVAGTGGSYQLKIGAKGGEGSQIFASKTPDSEEQPTELLNRPSNLWANLSEVTGVTVTQLRNSAVLQQLLELDAAGGTRYVEKLANHWDVISGDARQQRPEKITGSKQPIQVTQVPMTNQTTSGESETNQNLGDLGAYSQTLTQSGKFKKSFTEHGIIMALATIRYPHTYQQSSERKANRRYLTDYYDPIMAHISEQPILNKEIFAQGNEQDNEIFGWQEPWADLKFSLNRTSGDMRSAKTESLDRWHYGDFYKELPKLSSSWIGEDLAPVDRTMVYDHTVSPQWKAMFALYMHVTRNMPLYNLPGLKRI